MDIFIALGEQGLVAYDALRGIDWAWLAMDGAMTQAPLGGKKVGKHPTDRGMIGTKRRIWTDSGSVPIGLAVDDANRHDCKLTQETTGSFSFQRMGGQQALWCQMSPSCRSDLSRDPCRLSRLKPLLHRRQTEN